MTSLPRSSTQGGPHRRLTVYQQTFIDTYTKVAAKLYDRKTPITAADLLNDRVLPFFHGSLLRCMSKVLALTNDYALSALTVAIWGQTGPDMLDARLSQDGSS
jgi:hypothetical protein